MNNEEKTNITDVDIKEVIKNYYGEISEEDLEEIYQTIVDNFDIEKEEDVLEILKQAEAQNDDEEDEEIDEEETPIKEEVIEEKPTHNIEEVSPVVKKEEPEVKEDIPTREEVHKEKKPKKAKQASDKKKKIILLSCIGAAILILIIIAIFILTRPNDEKETTPKKSKPTTWQSVLKSEAKDGTLKDKIQDEIDDLHMSSTTADVMLLDIDSDEDYELIAYVESGSSKKILSFEIDKEVKFAEDYDLSDSESIGYVYNKVTSKAYWFVYTTSYTIISNSSKEVDAEEFAASYYVITKEYDKKNILNQAETINLSSSKKDISKAINEILDNKYTNEELLDNNKLTLKDVKKKIEEEKQAEEEEQKKAEEEEAKKKAEEEAARKKAEEEAKKAEEAKKKQEAEATTVINGYNFKFGKYVSADGSSSIVFSNDGTITYNGASSCSYKVSGESVTCGNLEFSVHANNTFEMVNGEDETVTYKFSN